ncbi:MAG: hypothetical protein R2761_24515 [Acidimicrobiales bacterium]
MIGRYAKGLTAGDDEVVWSQMRDYWLSTGQLTQAQVDSIGVDTEHGFRQLGLWASWGHGSEWDPQAQTADTWFSSAGARTEMAAWGDDQQRGSS